MEQVFFRVDMRIAHAFCSIFNANLRATIETISFVNAALVWVLLFWLHSTYIPGHGSIESGNSCVSTLINSHPDPVADIWKISLISPLFADIKNDEIILEQQSIKCGSITLNDLYNEYVDSQIDSYFIEDNSGLLSSAVGSSSSSAYAEGGTSTENSYVAEVHCDPSVSEEEKMAYKRKLLESPLSSSLINKSHAGYDKHLTVHKLFESQYVYYYSKHKSVMMMRPELCSKYGITMQSVSIVQSSSECFGENARLNNILQKYVGYESVMRSWVMDHFKSQGYMFSVHSQHMTNLYSFQDAYTAKSFSFLWSTIFVTLFYYFITSSLVSLTLKSTQENMLKFAYLLTHHVRSRIPYFHLVASHVVSSFVFVPILIGLQYFVVEFFYPHFLSFLLTTLVWMGEVFTVLW